MDEALDQLTVDSDFKCGCVFAEIAERETVAAAFVAEYVALLHAVALQAAVAQMTYFRAA